jgi:hypothetical protein
LAAFLRPSRATARFLLLRRASPCEVCLAIGLTDRQRKGETIVFDITDPKTFWLNVTNLVLGLVTLICCLVIAKAVISELWARRRHAVLKAPDPHSLAVDGLGLTMADGGEPLDPDKK